jgi:hypothetical protein
MLEKISGKISTIGGAILIIGSLIAYLGFQIQTPTDTLDKHISSAEKTHITFEAKLDSANKQGEHVEHVESLLEGLLRGECLENPKENLVRQGLIKKCEELGIIR